MTAPAWCALGLGSNLGDRVGLLDEAFQALSALPWLHKIRRAPLYETAPVGCPEGSPAFLNTIVTSELACPPLALLDAERL